MISPHSSTSLKNLNISSMLILILSSLNRKSEFAFSATIGTQFQELEMKSKKKREKKVVFHILFNTCSTNHGSLGLVKLWSLFFFHTVWLKPFWLHVYVLLCTMLQTLHSSTCLLLMSLLRCSAILTPH